MQIPDNLRKFGGIATTAFGHGEDRQSAGFEENGE